jgi:hypothetical protein
MNDEALICFGDDIKATGDGKFGGYVVRWGSPADTDVQGEYFTPETDFWGDISPCAGVVYHHGIGIKGDPLAAKLHKRRVGKACMKADEIGLKVEGSMADMSDPDLTALYQRIMDDEMGFSSGSVERLVARKAVKGKAEITTWPIIEISITPKPVEPRNRVYAMKALIEAEAGEAVAATLVDRAEALVADAEEIVALFAKAADQRRGEGRNLSERKREAVKALRVSLDDIYLSTAPMPTHERLAALRRKVLAARIGVQNG